MSDSANAPGSWDIQTARALYNIDRWGAKCFDINEAGRVVAMPLQESGAAVELTDVVEEAKARGLKFPLLIRFQDILRHREFEPRSEEHTSELQSRFDIVCRLLLEKKNDR